MALHKAMAVMLGLAAVGGCGRNPTPPEVLAGGTAPPRAAISLHAPSLQTRAPTAVMLSPTAAGKRIGTLAAGARIRATSAVTGDGCVMGWVLLAPRGYVCGDVLDSSPEPAWVVEPADAITKPSFAGYDLVAGKASLPIAVVIAPGGATVWSVAAPARALRKLPSRTFAPIVQIERNAANPAKASAYRISATEWISPRDTRLITTAPVPAGYIEGERWLDIDLDAQTLTAYEGLMPVLVTLVSTGLDATPTPTGVYRIWKKLEGTDSASAGTSMRGAGRTGVWADAGSSTPWVQLFVPETGVGLYPQRNLDRLGNKASRGGVLISLTDGAWLYRWTAPAHAAGWTMTAGVIESPGTLIQLRSAKDATPSLRGYALSVEEAQAERTPAYMNDVKP